ncbi:universal stress protein [Streptomyces sp. WM6378]|uniref:universal stress protein n=1 Tax=Streptomyces sp. WM6378 TaxID=1415557 RepID=UPI0006AE4CAA|nr:universal stress protein [Streptomyces sp. WM6378]KOU33458.1 universal stress protein UspA [Streptomyces sp. WM6378]
MEGSITGGSEPGSVVVGVDGSEQARAAALWAAAEAVRRGSSLHLVHATDTDGRAADLSENNVLSICAEGRELLEHTAAAVSERHPGLPVTTELSRGGPAVSLHGAAANEGILVVGNRGLGGFNSLLLGSVGLKVAASARTPVIVVRGTADPDGIGTVLVAVRDEHDLVCARHAAREAALCKASLRLLHVWNLLQSVGHVAPLLDDVDELAGGRMGSVAAVADLIRAEFPELTVDVDAEKSVSVAAVLVEASHHAQLLVMGGRRSPGYIGPTLGRVTHSLLHHAHCPVELIPRSEKEHGGGS